MKSIWMILVLLTSLTLFGCNETSPEVQAQQLVAQQAQANTVIFVSATWCGPCKAMKRTTLVDDEVIAVANRYNVVHLDYDANRSTVTKLGIRTVPTVLVGHMGQDGTWVELDRRTGYVDAKTFAGFLRSNLPR